MAQLLDFVGGGDVGVKASYVNDSDGSPAVSNPASGDTVIFGAGNFTDGSNPSSGTLPAGVICQFSYDGGTTELVNGPCVFNCHVDFSACAGGPLIIDAGTFNSGVALGPAVTIGQGATFPGGVENLSLYGVNQLAVGSQVLKDEVNGPYTGTVVLPAAGDVRKGTAFGASSGTVGTLVWGAGQTAAAIATRPGTPDVLQRLRSIEGIPVTLLARVIDGNGDLLTVATTNALAVEVFDRSTAEQIGTTLVPTVSSSIFDTLQTDGRWTADSLGYNLAVTVAGTCFPAGGEYRVELKITPAAGDPFFVLWNLDVEGVFSQ